MSVTSRFIFRSANRGPTGDHKLVLGACLVKLMFLPLVICTKQGRGLKASVLGAYLFRGVYVAYTGPIQSHV